MKGPLPTLNMNISGLGIILYAPEAARHIKEGADYLASHYTTASGVQEHIQAGSIVGFGTGTPGDFRLDFRLGAPATNDVEAAQFRLRLGLKTAGTIVCRDLYDLMSWTAAVPPGQALEVPPGTYRLTLLSSTPRSGILGDDQLITVFLEQVDSFPRLSTVGIPMLGP